MPDIHQCKGIVIGVTDMDAWNMESRMSNMTVRIGLTYLSGTGKKQRFLRVEEIHIYLIVNLSIKHILHNLRNVFYHSFCNFSKANLCYFCNFSKYFIFYSGVTTES